MSRSFREIHYKSNNDLNLYARDYPADNASLTILCLHGLTRNSADFSDFCQRMPSHLRLIVPDQRGRGQSDYDLNPANYNVASYAEDMFLLLSRLELQKVVIIGTSMGGLIGMTMCAMQPDSVLAMVLNDIGPDIEASGLNRIKAYTGEKINFPSWDEAEEYCKKVNSIAFPDYNKAQWAQFCKNTFYENDKGMVLPNYDPLIGTAFKTTEKSASSVDLWPLFEYLTRLPVLVVRGELSDILSRHGVSKMQSLHDNLTAIEVPNVGHAPSLTEPMALRSILAFVARR